MSCHRVLAVVSAAALIAASQVACTTTSVSQISSNSEQINIANEKSNADVRITKKDGVVVEGNLWSYDSTKLIVKDASKQYIVIERKDVSKYEQTTESAISKIIGDILVIPIGIIWILTGMRDN